MLMENLEKTKKSERKTPPITISGYTDTEMEELYSQAKSKLGEKPPIENLNEPKMDFKVVDRAVQHTETGKTVKIDPSRFSFNRFRQRDSRGQILNERRKLPRFIRKSCVLLWR